MKTLFLFLFAWSLQAANTTVADTVRYLNGSLATCTFSIYGPLNALNIPVTATAGDGSSVTPSTNTVNVTRGALSVSLHPNDDLTPGGTTYRVTRMCRPPGPASVVEYWAVPTSSSPVTIATVLMSWTLTASGAGAWGSITGTLSSQTDLQSALNGKQATLGSTTTTVNGQPCALGSTCTVTAAPTAHASSHASTGSDVVTPAAIGAAAADAATTVNGQTCALGSTCTVADATKIPTSAIDTDATMAANSDSAIASQKATKTALGTKAASNAATTVNGQTCALGSTCTVADATKIPTSAIDTDATMAANSDSAIPSQKAVKTALSSAGAAWGGITGLLPSQTDLETALDTRVSDKRLSDWRGAQWRGLPFKSDYEAEVTLAAGQQYIHALQYYGGYLYALTLSAPTHLVKLNPDTLATVATLDFPSDGHHDGANEMVYVASTNKIYIVFGDQNRTTIAAIDPAAMTYTDVVSDTAQGTAFSNCTSAGGGFNCNEAMATDGTYLYILTNNSPSSILKYAISGWAKTTATITGRNLGHALAYDGTNLWATGADSPGWLARITPSTLAFSAVTFITGDNVPTDDIGMTPQYVFIGLENASGTIIRVRKDSWDQDRIQTGIAYDCWGVFYDGTYIWAVFKSGGNLVRIDPTTLAVQQAVVLKSNAATLTNLSEMATDGSRYFFATYAAPGIIARADPYVQPTLYAHHYALAGNGLNWLDLNQQKGTVAFGNTISAGWAAGTEGGCATATDLVTDGTNRVKVTSASYTFVAADVGGWIDVTAGGGWTVGRYFITAVSSGAAILNVYAAGLGSTGGTFVVNWDRLIHTHGTLGSTAGTFRICGLTTGGAPAWNALY